MARIALDIDSTLHHYWDLLQRIARERYGVELGIHVLVDDSPVNIANARAEGIVPATIIHPWNEDILEANGVIAARDWRGLKAALEPVLDRLGAEPA